MPSALLLALLPCLDASARWRVEPAAVEVGEPFQLVLELEHEAGEALTALVSGELALGDSWLVFGPAESRREGQARRETRLVWQVASLEPGERSLAEELSAFALGPAVTRIQTGEARVSVTGVLAEGEDAPRALVGGDGELGAAPETPGFPWAILAGALTVLAAPLVFLWLRRRRARVAPSVLRTPEERLAELAARAAAGEGREGCYALTRLLREHTDRFRKKDRAALTDEEWLAEVGASLEVPKGALEELGGVFERAARVKYAGEEPSPWALEETFARARRALTGLGPEVRA